MSEPCACPPERQPDQADVNPRSALSPEAERIGQRFDKRFQDWQPIAPEATDMLFGWLRDAGLEGSTIMDVGCGTGEFLVRALEAGATRATGADLSSEAIAMAAELADKAGVRDRADLWVGDAAIEPLYEHDIFVLDKVICCYPNADALSARSTGAARRVYAFALPESRGFWGLLARSRWFIFGLMEWIQGDRMARFIHDREAVEAKVMAAGFRPVRTGRQFVWYVGVYARS